MQEMVLEVAVEGSKMSIRKLNTKFQLGTKSKGKSSQPNTCSEKTAVSKKYYKYYDNSDIVLRTMMTDHVNQMRNVKQSN